MGAVAEMCGIWGVVASTADDNVRAFLRHGRRLLSHRGPDGSGLHADAHSAAGMPDVAAGPAARGCVGLGHTRLKIIDLSDEGRQPMTADDGRVVLTYNGEIFNHRDLRRELEALGEGFHSDCDTEVVLRAYLRWGADCFSRFNGMFALAIADYRRGVVVLARDRFGIKPLYLTRVDDALLFASEIKAFFGHPGFEARPNPAVLGELVRFRTLAGWRTPFAGVESLPPGTVRLVPIGKGAEAGREHCYWSLDRLDPTQRTAGLDETTVESAVRDLLADSVRLRTVADVPVGMLLSGGVDSSLLAVLHRAGTEAPLRSFSVGFADADCDESAFARQAADRAGTEHSVHRFDTAAVAGAFAETVWHVEEPLNHPHTPLFLLLSRTIRNHVTVLLTGEASDEIFLGYSRHLRFLETVADDPDVFARQLVDSSGLMAPDISRRLLPDPACHASLAERHALVESRAAWPAERRLQAYDIATYLPSLLARLDRTTMAAGLEARTPFMDFRLVELAFSLPRHCKISMGIGKRVIKDISRHYFDTDFVDRPKIGFRTPFRKWLRESEAFRSMMADPAPIDGWLDERFTGVMLNRFYSGDDAFACSDVAWTVLNLKVWSRMFMGRESLAWRSAR